MQFFFQPMHFIENLAYLAKGMLGIFVTILIIVGLTVLLNRLGSKKQ